MRRFLFVCLLLVIAHRAASLAWARGGASPRAVTEHLLQRGFAFLRQAEQAHFANDLARARRFGRQAETAFRDALAQDPRESRAALMGGQAAVFAGDLRSAHQWIERLRRIAPHAANDPDLHYLRAFVFVIGEKQPYRALQELQRMYVLNARARPAERDKLWYLALLDHGRNLLRADRAEEALTQFRTGARIARRLGSRTKEMTMVGNIGVALQRAERFPEATELWASLVKQEPHNPVWHWQHGLVLAAQNKFAEAVPPYREVIRLREAGQRVAGMDEEMEFVYLRLGNCLRQLSERQRDARRKQELVREAEQLIRRFNELRPEEPLGHKWLGVMLYQYLDRPYEALPHFHRAFELDPACADSLRYVIQIHQRYPPPPDQVPKDDPAAAEAAVEAWRASIEGWKKDLAEGEARRKEILDRRERETGLNGCT